MNAIFRSSAAAILTLLFLLPQTSQAQTRAALVTEVSGTVTVTRAAGGDVAATWGMQLFEGDVVTTGADGAITLLFSDNNLVNLVASATVTVSATAAATGQTRAVPSQRVADVADLTLHRAGEGEIAALGGLRAAKAATGYRSQENALTIAAITPRNARVMDASPLFAWDASDGFDEFTVRVLDGSGEIWSETILDSEIRYPDGAPALVPGTEYYWQVTGIQMLDEIETELAPFEVLDAGARSAIEAEISQIEAMFEGDDEASSRDYLVGNVYAREGLLHEAVAAFLRIAERHPESSTAHEILGKLYYDMGMKDQAIEALSKALDSER